MESFATMDVCPGIDKGDGMATIHLLRQNEPYNPTVSELVPLWLADRRADGRRPRGIQNYREVFQRFIRFIGDPPITVLNSTVIYHYKRYLMERVSAGTARHALTVVRMFCAWAVQHGYLATNPAITIPHPTVLPPDPDPLSRADIARLLRALDVPPRTHRDTWGRTRRAVALMLYAGLRLAEVAGLEARDLDLDRRTITVRREVAKGGKPRIIPICDELATELEPLRTYEPTWAVVDQGDRPGKRGKHLTVKSLAHIFERFLPARGIRIHAHQLRRTFATELYVRGEDILTIQRLLGHTDPKTTIRYIGMVPLQERAAVARLTFRAELCR